MILFVISMNVLRLHISVFVVKSKDVPLELLFAFEVENRSGNAAQIVERSAQDQT